MSPILADSSPEIRHFYGDTFRRLSPLMQHCPSWGCGADYPTMNAMNKASVLTLLLATQAQTRGLYDYVRPFCVWSLMMAANVVTKLLDLRHGVCRNTTEGEYGAYSYAMNLVGAVVPSWGWARTKRFCATPQMPQDSVPKTLFAYAFSRGVVASLGLIVVLQLLASTVCGAIPESVAAFRIVAFVVLTTLIMEYVKSYARAMHLNHLSARIDVTYAWILVSATVGLTLGGGILGYALAVALAPLLAPWVWESKWDCSVGVGTHLTPPC